MVNKTHFWVLTIVATITAILVLINMVLFQANRSVQTEVASRQQFIQQSVQFEGLYREMIKALADLSVRNQDTELANLLAKQGISIAINPSNVTNAPAANDAKQGAK